MIRDGNWSEFPPVTSIDEARLLKIKRAIADEGELQRREKAFMRRSVWLSIGFGALLGVILFGAIAIDALL